MGSVSNGDIFNNLRVPLTRFSMWRYIWSRICWKGASYGCSNTNRKSYL